MLEPQLRSSQPRPFPTAAGRLCGGGTNVQARVTFSIGVAALAAVLASPSTAIGAAATPPPAQVADRAHYRANGEHKSYPSTQGLWTWVPAKVDKTKCARYAEADWPKLTEALRAAIRAPCVHREFRGDFPARAWAYVNGDLHEARLSNEGNGEYHAFPVLYEEQWPDDPKDLLRNAPYVTISVC